MRELKDRRAITFKVTGKAFAKTLQERTLKQPTFLSDLEAKETSYYNSYDRILSTPGGFLGIVLKNASFI